MYSEIIANLQVCALKEMLPQILFCESTQQPFIKESKCSLASSFTFVLHPCNIENRQEKNAGK